MSLLKVAMGMSIISGERSASETGSRPNWKDSSGSQAARVRFSGRFGVCRTLTLLCEGHSEVLR